MPHLLPLGGNKILVLAAGQKFRHWQVEMEIGVNYEIESNSNRSYTGIVRIVFH